MTDNTELTPDQLVQAYIRIRERRAELKRAYEEEDNGLKEKHELIKHALLDHCKNTGVESGKTAHGTFYRQKKTRYSAMDWAAVHAFIKEHDMLDLLERRISQTVVREYLEENPDDPIPGLNISSEYQIAVRK